LEQRGSRRQRPSRKRNELHLWRVEKQPRGKEEIPALSSGRGTVPNWHGHSQKQRLKKWAPIQKKGRGKKIGTLTQKNAKCPSETHLAKQGRRRRRKILRKPAATAQADSEEKKSGIFRNEGEKLLLFERNEKKPQGKGGFRRENRCHPRSKRKKSDAPRKVSRLEKPPHIPQQTPCQREIFEKERGAAPDFRALQPQEKKKKITVQRGDAGGGETGKTPHPAKRVPAIANPRGKKGTRSGVEA